MKVALVFIAVISTASVMGHPATDGRKSSPLELNLDSQKTGNQYNLNLVQPTGSVLHSNIQVVSVRKNNLSGNLEKEYWTPSKDAIQAATQNIYVDPKNLAVVKVSPGNDNFHGVVNGETLVTVDGIPQLISAQSQLQSDYLTLDDNLPEQSSILPSNTAFENASIVAEIAVVCDLDFGKHFNYNRQQILEYWTVYFWDINMRFKTLPSLNISLRVTSITIIETPEGQSFIEDTRNENGTSRYNRIIGLFGDYMYSNMETLPKFDMAMVASDTPMEWYGGLAYLNAACNADHGNKRHWGVMVYSDYGGYTNTYIAVHEIAHVLGAPHDTEMADCEDHGYIMGEYWTSLQWYFSSCSDRAIKNYVSTPRAACLYEINETGDLPVDPDFSSETTPTMTEQCQRSWGNSSAFVPEHETANCVTVGCHLGSTYRLMTPIQNSPCLGGGRCFRGRCIPESQVIVNVGSEQCVRATNGFTYNDQPELVDCVRSPTPLDKFVLNSTTNGMGTFLGTPFIIPANDSIENADKCLHIGTGSEYLEFGRCANEQQQISFGWDLIEVVQGEYLIKHKETGRCWIQSDNKIKTYTDCDSGNKAMLWKFK